MANTSRTIAAFVKNYRLEKGLTKTALAAEMGCSVQYIFNIEHGSSPLPKTFCFELLKKLGKDEREHLKGLMDRVLAVQAKRANGRKK